MKKEIFRLLVEIAKLLALIVANIAVAALLIWAILE